MSADRNHGGTAFPSHGSMGEVVEAGMTLRQWYAGLAMQSLVAVVAARPTEAAKRDLPSLSKGAYAIADQMIAEGEK